MKSYRNFKLKLGDYSKTEDGYESLTVYVDESPVGAQDWSERVEVKFPDELSERHERLRYRELTEEQELIAFGEDLAKLLFPSAVREMYYRSLARLEAEEGLRIQIYTGKPEEGNPDLRELELPWEYAYIWAPGKSDDKGHTGFLALDRRVSIVRYHKIADKGPTPPEPEVVRVVALLSDGSESGHGKLDMVQEEENLRQALVGVDGVDLELLLNGKLESLLSSLTKKNAQVFHYAGHGTIKKEPLDEAFKYKKVVYLVLAGEDGGAQLWDGEKVAIELGNRNIQLVVLSACDSGLSGLVPALVNQNIPAVIGMQFTVRDTNAVAFNRRFYQALANGKSIDAAVSEGRHGVFQRPVDAGRDWGVPVLHLQTDDDVLFPKPFKSFLPHKILFWTTAGVLSYWFFMHINPWLTQHISRLWEWLGMGGAAVAGLFLFIKTLRAETQKILPERKTVSWKERALHNHRSLQVLALACLASLMLFASTNSIYLEVDYARDVRVNVKTSNKSLWRGMPGLGLSQQEGKLLAGGPVFFKPWPVSLDLSLEKPAGWNLSKTNISLNPFRSTKLTIDKTLIVRLVPGNALYYRLMQEDKIFQLQVTIGDEQPVVLPNWLSTVVYAGADKSELETKLEWDEGLLKCLDAGEYDPDLAIEYQFEGVDCLSSTRMALGQSIIVEVVDATDLRAVDETDFEAFDETDLETVDKTCPKVVNKTDPEAVDTTDPSTILVYSEEFTLEGIGDSEGGVFTKCMILKD